MCILKLSYHHLWSVVTIKMLFAYCALFPKDNISKIQKLIDFWMAEGFLKPTTYESQSLDELGEEYTLILLQRCLFQDVKRDEYGTKAMTGENCKIARSEERNFK